MSETEATLVERLRGFKYRVSQAIGQRVSFKICSEAADEIERLTAENARLRIIEERAQFTVAPIRVTNPPQFCSCNTAMPCKIHGANYV